MIKFEWKNFTHSFESKKITILSLKGFSKRSNVLRVRKL